MTFDETLLHETIDALFAPRIASGVAPGSVVGVFDSRGELVYTRGFGLDRLDEDGSTPDADTAFRIASCTKSFTASAALLLRDRGALVLDQPITDFVPEFHWADGGGAGGADVPTLRQLLSMSGGLSTDDPWADRQEGLTDDEFRAVLAAGTPRDSVPGTTFRYSNLGYALVGQAIAHAAGVPFIDFVTAELLEPLGLTSTGFQATGRTGRTAVGHRRGVAGGWHPLPFSSPGAFSPIGGVVTTARDLARWGAWLLRSLDESAALADAASPGPLRAASRRELQQVHRTIGHARAGVQEFGYGFGLMVERSALSASSEPGSRGVVGVSQTISHSGGYPGFSAHLRWNAPGGFGVVAFENAGYAGVSEPATALTDTLIERAPSGAHPSPWPETIVLARAADRLITAWAMDAAADELEEQVLSPNVAQDQPIAERREEVMALGVTPADEEPEFQASASPAAVSWVRAATRGPVRVRLSLAPVSPARIQTLAIAHEKPAE